MLVLTRKYQEKVRIGDGITITVLRAKGKAVRLGIEAPADVPVIRGELAFHDPPEQSAEKDETHTSQASAVPEATARRTVRGDRQWQAESSSHRARRASHGDTTSQVTLHRVPREQAANVLPQLLSGRGPLREMLDLRAGTL